MKRPQSLTINVSEIKEENVLIQHLISSIGFPDLYEKSWSGFNEHLFYDPETKLPNLIIIEGINSLEQNLPNATKLLKQAFLDHAFTGESLMVVYKD
jgi:hypothetical protein